MKRIEFVNGETKGNAAVFNELQDNIEEAIEEQSTYSTKEQVIGTWINGKPIYRKVIDTGALPNTTNTEIDTGLDSTIVRPIRMYGYAYNSSGGFIALPYNIIDNGSIYLQYLSTNKIRITTSSDRSNMNSYVVLEYTKTTD